MILSALIRILKRVLPKIFKRVPGSNSKFRRLIGVWAKRKASHLKASVCLLKVAIKLAFYAGIIVLCVSDAKDIAYKLWTNNHFRFLALFIVAIISVEVLSMVENALELINGHYEDFRNDKEIAPILLWVWAILFSLFIHGLFIYVLSSFRP